MRRGRAIDGQGMLENERARSCVKHTRCRAGRTRKKARFIYYLLYHPRSRLRARARFHSFLSSYTNTQEQHSGPSPCALAFVLLIFPHTLRLPFLLHRSEYSRDLLENLATAGAADAARVSVPARRIADGARHRREPRVPAVSIRGQGR